MILSETLTNKSDYRNLFQPVQLLDTVIACSQMWMAGTTKATPFCTGDFLLI